MVQSRKTLFGAEVLLLVQLRFLVQGPLTLRVGGLSSLRVLPGESLTSSGPHAELPFFRVRLLRILAQSRRTESAGHENAGQNVLYFGNGIEVVTRAIRSGGAAR